MIDCANIHGFNYQPSYGTSGLEIWQRFDAGVIDHELTLGKKYFPKMNAIRLWLSWDAFQRDPRRGAANFDRALQIAQNHGLVVMPVLFNRWHDTKLDYGGIYFDHFLPGSSSLCSLELARPFLETIVGEHADDPRVFCWDLCNEPNPATTYPAIAQAEYDWLAWLYRNCKQVGAKPPLTIGSHYGCRLAQVEAWSDLLSIHPYLFDDTPACRVEFEAILDDAVAIAQRTAKPLLATETCWGSLDDATRVVNMRYTLGELKKRQIGWLAYGLHHSLIADLHRPEFGPVGVPGNLAFIEADGTLRPGHAAFNEF